jgi:hypothetical protein
MRIEPVEIYSDETNAAVMRHPGRRFPGLLFQGDTLHSMCLQADEICACISRGAAGFEPANALRNRLWAALNHYKSTLDDHNIPVPFNEHPING